jgi:hypothetical protein
VPLNQDDHVDDAFPFPDFLFGVGGAWESDGRDVEGFWPPVAAALRHAWEQ